MFALLVAQHVAAGHQEQAFAALEKKAAGIGQQTRAQKGAQARGGKRQGFDHRKVSAKAPNVEAVPEHTPSAAGARPPEIGHGVSR
jgi:hypothetical protein